MELVESHTRQDADLGGTFISEKEVTLNFKGDDLKYLHEMYHGTRSEYTEEQIETLNELLGHILEGVSNYDLV
jgi:hypothetical protein|tara:strand:- start:6 stop:224 length:219 start_codon:yes stop_codon:yes gene_type:complete